jgi:hypothetical protein
MSFVELHLYLKVSPNPTTPPLPHEHQPSPWAPKPARPILCRHGIWRDHRRRTIATSEWNKPPPSIVEGATLLRPDESHWTPRFTNHGQLNGNANRQGRGRRRTFPAEGIRPSLVGVKEKRGTLRTHDYVEAVQRDAAALRRDVGEP